ncbi:hypothetical protein E1180_14475 [Roseibium denhamense]|nr:PhnD/SsuA/transferrin family substrate-binding protein [Roseibium denhamense]MTI06719.1 hypothetical protein [Roseibium denhamense]
MYDWPEVRAETCALEQALTEEICSALKISLQDLKPWPDDIKLYDIWKAPGLLLAQTCGYPFTHALKHRVALIGAPHYRAEGCAGALYRSHIVVRADDSAADLADLKGKRLAVNSLDSQSGMNALRAEVAGMAEGSKYFETVIMTGGHVASLHAVAAGDADLASIDAVCWHMATRYKPELASCLKSIGLTREAPGLPFIASSMHDQTALETIRRAAQAVLTSTSTQKSRERLAIHGFSVLNKSVYQVIEDMEEEATSLQYPNLA